MSIAVLDYYRVRTGLPWIPGGVAVHDGKTFLVRYDDDEIALDAKLRFRRLVSMTQDAIDRGMDPLEAVTRGARSTASGYLSWQVFLEVPDDSPRSLLNRLFDHYVTRAVQDLYPGSAALEPAPLPFG